MNAIKKILFGGLLFCLILTTTACSKSDNDTNEVANNNVTEKDGNPKLFDESDCWSVYINGVKYTFPMKYEDFIANGFEVFNLKVDDTLYPKVTNSTFSAKYTETGTSFDLVFANFSNEKIDYKEGYIVGISKNFTVTKSVNDKMPKIVLPGGFVFNEQPTLDEMEDVYGTSNKEEYGDKIYIFDNHILTRCWEFSYNSDNELDGFSVVNYDNPEKND